MNDKRRTGENKSVFNIVIIKGHYSQENQIIERINASNLSYFRRKTKCLHYIILNVFFLPVKLIFTVLYI